MTRSNSHSNENCSHFIISGGSNSHFISGKREAIDTRFYLSCAHPAYWAQDYCWKENLFPRMGNHSCWSTILWEAWCLKHYCLAKKILLPRCIYFSSSSYLFRIIIHCWTTSKWTTLARASPPVVMTFFDWVCQQQHTVPSRPHTPSKWDSQMLQMAPT